MVREKPYKRPIILLRYWWAIQPRNAVGASCSFFLFVANSVQIYRRWHYDNYVAGTAEDPAKK